MLRKGAWAAVVLLPLLMAAEFLPTLAVHILCALAAALFLASLFLRFRFRSGTLLVTGIAFIGLCSFIFYQTFTLVPLYRFENEPVQTHVLVTKSDGRTYTVKALSGDIDLPGTFEITAYYSELKPYSTADIVLRYHINESRTAQASGYYIEADEVSEPENIREDEPLPLIDRIDQWRMGIIDTIRHKVGGDAGALAAAMLTGNKDGLSYQAKNDFTRCGMSHIMAVSGLHLSVITGIFTYLLLKLAVNRHIKSLLSVICVSLVILVGGFSVSVIRAGIMSLIVLFGSFFYKKSDPVNSLGIAMSLIAVVSPASVFSAGYLLSGSATLGILLLSPVFEEKLNALRRKIPAFIRTLLSVLIASVGATLFTMPVLILCFGEISLVGIPCMVLLNFPITGALICAVLLYPFSWIPLLGELIAFWCSVFSRITLWIVSLFSSFPYATVALPEWTAGVILAAAVGIFLVLRSAGKKRGLLCSVSALIMIFPIVFYAFYQTPLNELTVWKDYGGGCTCIVKNGTVIVVDCSSEYAASDVADHLLQNGYRRIDLLIISSLDNPCAAGCDELAQMIPISSVCVTSLRPFSNNYRNLMETAKKCDIMFLSVDTDREASLGDIKLRFYMTDFAKGEFATLIDTGKEKIACFPRVHQKAAEDMEKHADILIVGSLGEKEEITPAFLGSLSPGITVAITPLRPYDQLSERERDLFTGLSCPYYETMRDGDIILPLK